MKKKIPSVELTVYFVIWILTNFAAIYKLYDAQTGILNDNPHVYTHLKDLKPGWSSLRRLKDTSDVEWSSWKYFVQTSWFYLIVQSIFSEIIRRHSVSYLKPWYIFSSALIVILHMGVKHLLLILAQPILYSAIIFMGGGKTTIWFVSIILLSTYNSLKYNEFFWDFLDHDNIQDEEIYLILFCVAWVELRCISFCLDYIEKNKKIEDNIPASQVVINMLSYVLYAPVLYTGPVILYENFENSFLVENESIAVKLKRFFIDMFLFLLYSFVLDLSLHYIYFHAMQDNMESMRKFSTLDLIGGGLWMGLEFHMKYVIAYGTTTAFARLDNMNPPPTPRCISRIHVYSQMWRYFDVGLYKFLVKYIYKPSFDIISQSIDTSRTAHKLMASFGTFAFIYLWHGTIKRIFLWTALNYLGITFEYTIKAFGKTERYLSFKANVLKTEAMETRLIAILCVPGLILSGLSNYYLFAGDAVGNLFLDRIMHASLFNTLVIWAALYCCCQVSIALQDVSSRTDIASAAAVPIHLTIIKQIS